MDVFVNIQEAELALTQKPLLATSAERFLILDDIKSDYRELSHPLRFAKLLSLLLARVSVPLAPHDLIAGRCVDRLLTAEEERRFAAFIRHPDFPDGGSFLSSGHATYSWEMVVSLGLPGLKAQAQERLSLADDPEQRDFLLAILEIYDAIAAYLLRYADAADAAGMHALSENLHQAATTQPQSFVVALQLLWTITLIDCAYITENPTLTVGRLDQILYPLYRADLDAGRLTRQEAAAYVTDYYCKHNLIMGRGEHQVGDASNSTTFARILNFDAPQYLLLAGRDEKGSLAVNELTELFAECIVPSFKNPVVVVRYVKGMDESAPVLWKTLTEKALASASLMFYNDDNVYATWRRMGLPEQDARAYAHFGCNWPTTGDNGAWFGGGPSSVCFDAYENEEEKRALAAPYMRMNAEHGWPEDLVEVLGELYEQKGESVTIEDVYERFFSRMSDFLDRKLAFYERELAARRRHPARLLTFGDAFLRNSIKEVGCFAATAKYHFELQSFQMFGTVADSVIALDQLVFVQKKLTLGTLLDALRADFVGFEEVLALCRGAEKYGQDTPLSNAHAKRLSHTACSLVIEKNKPYFEKDRLFLVPCMQSDTWHLKKGEAYGATPDGRRAGIPFSQNSRPSNGVCKNGITAMFNAMLNLPTDGLLSGALNLDVDPRQFSGENGKAVFAALLAAYFNRGGLHAQVSALSKEALSDAVVHPDAHRDLRVRVTGYSGVFVDICPRLQNDIIKRFE
ncbi:MAG: hypothetical protein IJV96_04305 [Clostridia bacterium]|nr:hypothetical protein [Clostridia bacterium]